MVLDAQRIGVELDIRHSKVRRPIRTASVPLANEGRDVEIALPEVDTQNLRTHLAVESGRGVLFRMPLHEEGRERCLFLSVRRVVPEDLEKPGHR